jgi:hypothetical protein
LSRIAKHGEPLRDWACEVCFGAVQLTYFKLDFDGLLSQAVACVQYGKWLTIPWHWPAMPGSQAASNSLCVLAAT